MYVKIIGKRSIEVSKISWFRNPRLPVVFERREALALYARFGGCVNASMDDIEANTFSFVYTQQADDVDVIV